MLYFCLYRKYIAQLYMKFSQHQDISKNALENSLFTSLTTNSMARKFN